jgi:hypothetical protein
MSLVLAAQIQREPLIVPALTALAARSIVWDDLRHALKYDFLNTSDRTGIAQMLRDIDGPPPPISYFMRGELAFAYDIAQWADDAKAPAPKMEPFNVVFDAVRKGYVSTRDGVDAIAKTYPKLTAILESKYSPDLMKTYKAAETEASEHDKFTKVALASFDRAYLLLLRGEASRRATHLIYELFIYRDKNQTFPRKLADLDQKAAADLLIDPFSNKPFVYRLEGDSFLLYSVAQNAKDDGGKHDPKWGDEQIDADYVFWPIRER